MDWNLVSKNKHGEIQVNFFWISILIVFIGFLFGLGFKFADFVINYTFANDGYYIYYFVNKYKIGILLIVLILFVIKISKENK
jgi:hypothetical protein